MSKLPFRCKYTCNCLSKEPALTSHNKLSCARTILMPIRLTFGKWHLMQSGPTKRKFNMMLCHRRQPYNYGSPHIWIQTKAIKVSNMIQYRMNLNSPECTSDEPKVARDHSSCRLRLMFSAGNVAPKTRPGAVPCCL